MLIDIETVKRHLAENHISVKGILHVGSHVCEEKNAYNSNMGIPDTRIVWVDANKDVVNKNRERGILNCYEAAIDETERDATFHIVSNIQSSSLLELGTHLQSYPHIKEIEQRPVKTKTLKTFFQENHLDVSTYNFWNFDIQGNELYAYKGAGDLFRHCDALYTGIDTDYVYKNCGQLYDLDTFLEKFGLYRVETNLTSQNWGDALYVRKANPFQKKEPIDLNYTLYEKITSKYGDAHDHLMTLSKYAKESNHVLEFGGKVVSASWALINGLKKNRMSEKHLTTYFLQPCLEFEKLQTACEQNSIQFDLYLRENLQFMAEEKQYDMIYFDTWRVYGQVKRELERFSKKAKKYILIHGTEKYKNVSESIQQGVDIQLQSQSTGLTIEEIMKGTQPALDEFLQAHPEWKVKEHSPSGYGLTVLYRT